MSEARTTKYTALHPVFKKLRLNRQRRQIPVIQQVSATECGAASLAMVLGYHGRATSVDELRAIMGIDRNGASALTILQAAQHCGLRARGIKIDVNDLEYLPPASILHWEFSHFVVFERRRAKGVELVDPAFGRRFVPYSDFNKSFTGVALLFEPTEAFAEAPPNANRLWLAIKRVLSSSRLLPRIALISILMQLFGFAVPLLTSRVIDKVIPRNDTHLLLALSVAMGGVVVFNSLSTLLRSHLLLYLRTYLDTRMTLGFLEHLVDLPFSFFQLRSAGDLMMRLNSNTQIREILTAGTLSALIDGSMTLVYLIILFVVSVKMGCVVLLIGIVQATVFFLSRRRQRELAAKSLQVEAKSQSYQVEMLTAMETLKAMGAEPRAVAHWSDLFVDVLNLTLDRGRLGATVDSLTSFVRMGASVGLLVFGTWQVLQHSFSAGDMLAINSLAANFLTPLASLVSTAMQFQLIGSYLDRINDVMQTPPEQDRTKVKKAHPLGGEVVLDRVSFRYGVLAPLVVDDVSVRVRPGQFVAVVGRSGAGKSTMAHLFLGLYLPATGRITYDGVDLKELDVRSVRRQVGIVTQHHDLMGGTIRDNIALADPSLTLDEIMEAAKLAQIHDEITAMPLGYSTPLVDRGASLSGGQRQRLALARALVHKPAILLLDEATSALDAVTESKVQQSLASLKCTRIVIAHRLSTVVSADLILVMHDGKIAEAGTHHELLQRRGVYEELTHSQLQLSA